MDRTESKLKIFGFIGSAIVGISGAAVATWKTCKETDKLHQDKLKQQELEESNNNNETSEK